MLQYLDGHDEITNAIARELTGINSENTMKEVFYDLRDTGFIERVPGKAGNKSAWQLVQPTTSAKTPDPTSTAGSDRRGPRTQPRRLTRAPRKGRKS